MRWLVLLVVPVLVVGSVASQEKPAPTDVSKLPSLKVGETLEGEIIEDDPTVMTEILRWKDTWGPTRGGAYRIQIEESGPYHIDLKSCLFDAYLVLRGADGAVLLEDDDGLVFWHARIVAELESGKRYQVEVCALYGMTGSFEVVLRKGPAKEISPIERSRLGIEEARETVRRVEAARGPDHRDVAWALNNLAILLTSQGVYAEARPLFERSLEIREKTLGPNHPEVATSLSNLAALLYSQGQYSEARPLLKRSLKIQEKTLGPDHPDVALVLNNLAELLKAQGQYSEARPLYERSLKIREKTLGPDHPDVAASLSNLAALLYSQGLYPEARPLYERSHKIREKTFGANHPDVAASLSNLAALLYSQGLYPEARPLYERSLKIFEKTFGPDHPDVALVLNNLANLLTFQGLYPEAWPLYERSLKIREKTLGPDHPHVATSLNNLAELLTSQGQYSEARPLYERSLKIREKTLGPNHPDVAASLSNLAALLHLQGLYPEAWPLYERSLKIREKTLGANHPEVATSLSNLAALLYSQGRYSEARPLFERSLKIFEKTFGPDHPDVATPLSNLASFLKSQDQYSEARPLLERSLKIREKTFGPDHPDVALVLNNLAALLYSQGQYSEARPLHERSLKIWEKTLGPDHPNVAASLNNLAMLEANDGESRRAFELASRALLSDEAQLEATLLSQTESERLRYAGRLRSSLELYVSLAREGLTGGGGLEVASSVLSRKGRVARSLLGRESQHASLSSEERAMVGQLRSVQKRLSDALYSREVSDREAHQELLMNLRDRKKELELALVRWKNHEFSLVQGRGEREGKGAKERKRGMGWERGKEAAAVQGSLPEGSVAVNFLVHRIYRPTEWKGKELVRKGGWDRARVSAFLVPSGKGDLQWLDLGEASVLEDATKEFLGELISRRGLQKSETTDSSPTTAAMDRLRELLWDPLRELIGESELVIISPDTFLGTLPFETLQEKDGSYLIEKRSFVYIQDLLSLVDRKRESEAAQPRLFAVGGIDYGRRGKLDSEFLRERLVAQAETRGGLPPRWGRLSLTGQEADAIVGLFEETRGEDGSTDEEDEAFTLLMRRSATEEAVKHHLESHSYVHLATHGYFQPEGLPSAWKNAQEEAEKNRTGEFLEETERAITGLMPGLLSGLVFSGANAEPEEGRDNGLLTAEETTYLDLSDCQLVVLSACETGLGRPEGGEGMIGLRRSFRQAGARTVISSLWQVRDDSTQELMERFYENLWLKKMGKLEALRQAQLWMLERNREEDGEGLPSTWGAFVLDGDWE